MRLAHCYAAELLRRRGLFGPGLLPATVTSQRCQCWLSRATSRVRVAARLCEHRRAVAPAIYLHPVCFTAASLAEQMLQRHVSRAHRFALLSCFISRAAAGARHGCSLAAFRCCSGTDRRQADVRWFPHFPAPIRLVRTALPDPSRPPCRLNRTTTSQPRTQRPLPQCLARATSNLSLARTRLCIASSFDPPCPTRVYLLFLAR